jgi:hypothetical protein
MSPSPVQAPVTPAGHHSALQYAVRGGFGNSRRRRVACEGRLSRAYGWPGPAYGWPGPLTAGLVPLPAGLVPLPRAGIHSVQHSGANHGTQDGAEQRTARQATEKSTGDGANQGTKEEAPAVAVRFISHGHSLRGRFEVHGSSNEWTEQTAAGQPAIALQ